MTDDPDKLYGYAPGGGSEMPSAEELAKCEECQRLREKADSMLSLIRHRGGVKWDGVGMATEAGADKVIGSARRMYEKVKAILGASPELS